LEVRREIRLLKESDITAALGFALDPAIRAVAFHSANTIANTGSQAWKKETGLLSIWILGMFGSTELAEVTPTPATTVVVPFNQAVADGSVPVVNDVYFGKVPSERLAVKDGVIYFSGDGKYRSKIGLAPARAKSVLGSYDASNQVLTLVQYNQPEGVTDYVNSLWQIQDDPYAGDVVNSYNDGPPAPGAKPLGPFYELETSSPAAALKPGESLSHLHRTLHFQGPEEKLDMIAQKTLGVTIAKIKTADFYFYLRSTAKICVLFFSQHQLRQAFGRGSFGIESCHFFSRPQDCNTGADLQNFVELVRNEKNAALLC
jgi:hypothetical protein